MLITTLSIRFLIVLCALISSLKNACCQSELAKLDAGVLMEYSEDRTYGQQRICQRFSNTTGLVSLSVPMTLLIAGSLEKNAEMKQNGLIIGESILVGGILSTTLKHVINRQRPFHTYPDDISKASVGGGPSFPSGHTTQAFSTATAVSLAYPKWYVIVPAYLWACEVGYSRMYLGVHYPSDVIAGAVLGAGSAWLTRKVNKGLRKQPVKLVRMY